MLRNTTVLSDPSITRIYPFYRSKVARTLPSLYTNNTDRVLLHTTCGPNFLGEFALDTNRTGCLYSARRPTLAHTRTQRSTMAVCGAKERRESGSTRRSTATMNTTRPYGGTARTTLRVIAGASRSRRCADAGCAHAAAHDAAATSRDARSHSLTRTHACAMHAPTRAWLSTYNYPPLSFFLFLFLYVYAMRCRGW